MFDHNKNKASTANGDQQQHSEITLDEVRISEPSDATSNRDVALPELTLPLNLLLAVAACITVSNLYWSQPLLAQMAESFGVQQGSIGVVATCTTIGYATGLLFVTPVGDMLR